MGRKKSKCWLAEAINYAESKGGVCLGIGEPTKHGKAYMYCESGHYWEPSLENLLRGGWCRECLTLKQRHAVEDAIMLGNRRGFTCLSYKYVRNGEKLKWMCSYGHLFDASFNKIQQGRGCPHCSKRVKHTIEFAQKLANNMGGECLTKEYINVVTSMSWKCKRDHIFTTCLANVMAGKWCKECYHIESRKYTIKDAQHLAKENGGWCLSDKYINFTSKMIWKCNQNHIWSASFSSIKSGTWCKSCSKHKTQNKISEIIENIYGEIKTNYKGFDWLAGDSGCKQEIDIWVPKLKLAIEYDGEQHFKPVEIFGGEKTFNKTQALDKIKDIKIESHPEDVEYFIRIPYYEIDIRAIDVLKIKDILKNHNVPVD